MRALGAKGDSAFYNYFLKFERGEPSERFWCVRAGGCFSFPKILGVVGFHCFPISLYFSFLHVH